MNLVRAAGTCECNECCEPARTKGLWRYRSPGGVDADNEMHRAATAFQALMSITWPLKSMGIRDRPTAPRDIRAPVCTYCHRSPAPPVALVRRDPVSDGRMARMKGINGLEEPNIYIAVTNLSPVKYAELNVVGRWLEIDNIIAPLLRGSGEPSGRSESWIPTITSARHPHDDDLGRRLWRQFLRELPDTTSRVQFHIDRTPAMAGARYDAGAHCVNTKS